MYLSAIAAFCSMSPHPSAPESKWNAWRIVSFCVRLAGLAALRSALCGVLILLVSTSLNRLGFRLKL
jgi:hypothetical protein